MILLYLPLLSTEEQKNKFERIYTKYRGLIFHEAFQICQNHATAEDITHDTFLHIIKIIDIVRVENEKELVRFICLMTHNKSVDYIRKWKHEVAADDAVIEQLSQESVNPETVAINAMILEEAIAQLEQLNPSYRVPLELKVSGYSIHEIASILDISENLVTTRIHRARAKLLERVTTNA